jgi:hypothetical protein
MRTSTKEKERSRKQAKTRKHTQTAGKIVKVPRPPAATTAALTHLLNIYPQLNQFTATLVLHELQQSQQPGLGFFDRTVNLVTSAWNRVFGKKTLNRARDGEKHAILKLPDNSLQPALYAGPGSKTLDRIKEQVLKAGGDYNTVKGLTNINTAAAAHDIRYALAKDTADVRVADKKMIAKIRQLQGDPATRESLLNQASLLGIQGKVALEKLGVLSPSQFTSFKAVPDDDRQVYTKALQSLEQRGFAKKKRRLTKWNTHVREYAKKHPGMAFKQLTKAAAASYRRCD